MTPDRAASLAQLYPALQQTTGEKCGLKPVKLDHAH